MKLPSFIKLPGHKKFTITPRYYDPIKEKIMERTKAIKRKMSREENFEISNHKITFEGRSSQRRRCFRKTDGDRTWFELGYNGLALLWKLHFKSPLAYYSYLFNF